MSDLPPIAVIADIHFHDLDADFGFPGITIADRRLAVRSWSETRLSTRVFNESARALHAALEAVIDRGIRHVVLLGDYSDDGQRSTLLRLREILTDYTQKHGLNFYALPGNHDIFGPAGRHQTKEFLGKDGEPIVISSDAELQKSGVVISADMYCEGYPAGLHPMREFGYYRNPSYLHWETPFGASDADADRTYEAVSADGRNKYRLMDASYLVEPEPGLWLLMIDANIFEPRNGEFAEGEEAAFIDSTGAGWNALLRCKPFLIDWLADVAARAKASGKTLLAFSHYPALDVFDGASASEAVLFGATILLRRTPQPVVAETLVRAGIEVHFSGHLHVEGVTHRRIAGQDIRNIAVPSLVAFPPAFKTVEVADGTVTIDTVPLNDLRLDPDILSAYEWEAEVSESERTKAFSAGHYEEFLLDHLRELIRHRYMRKEWPAGLADQLAHLDMADILGLLSQERDRSDLLAALAKHSNLSQDDIASIPFIEVVLDWYCLRQASQLAFDVIAPERRKLYSSLVEHLGQSADVEDDKAISFVRAFLSAFAPLIERASRHPNRLTISVGTSSEVAA